MHVPRSLEGMTVLICIVLLNLACYSPRQAFSARVLSGRGASEGSVVLLPDVVSNRWSRPITCDRIGVVHCSTRAFECYRPELDANIHRAENARGQLRQHPYLWHPSKTPTVSSRPWARAD